MENYSSARLNNEKSGHSKVRRISIVCLIIEVVNTVGLGRLYVDLSSLLVLTLNICDDAYIDIHLKRSLCVCLE